MMSPSARVLLLILDGWGLAPASPGNAITQAGLTHWPRLLEGSLRTTLQAGGEAFGLPSEEAGNSELGHRALGSGQRVQAPYGVVSQWAEATLSQVLENPEAEHALTPLFEQVKQAGSTLHLVGLLGQGTVHSSLEVLLDTIHLAKLCGVPCVRVHAFSDGRDTSPGTWPEALDAVETLLLDCGYPQITTITGRYYGMDRDQHWERTEKAFNAIAYGVGARQFLAQQALKFWQVDGASEEFLEPSTCDLVYKGVEANDAVLFFNHRADRLLQLAKAFSQPQHAGFTPAQTLPNGLMLASLLPIEEGLPVTALLQLPPLTTTLGEVLSQAGLTQFRLAESEKFAHVTYFFNGGKQQPYAGEQRCIVPSPRVASYDLQPEMSLPELTQHLVTALKNPELDVLIVNIANPDMIGHTGNWDAALKAAKAVDDLLGQLLHTLANEPACQTLHTLITADHGNLEAMLTEEGKPNTAHANSPVPLVFLSAAQALKQWQLACVNAEPAYNPTLANVVNTVLTLLGLPQHASMEPALLAVVPFKTPLEV